MLKFPDVLSIRAKCSGARTSNGLSTSLVKTDQDRPKRNIWDGPRSDTVPGLASDVDFQHPDSVAEQLTNSNPGHKHTHESHTGLKQTQEKVSLCEKAWKNKNICETYNRGIACMRVRESEFWILE